MADFVFRNVIVRAQSFREKSYQNVAVMFSSFLEVNLSYVQMERGRFLGNGWEGCNLFGLRLLEGRMEREQFLKCSMGNTRFENVKLFGVRFDSIGFMGSVWEEVAVKRGKFRDCNFRNMQFVKAIMEETIFQACIFDNTNIKEVELSNVVFVDCVFLEGQEVPRKGCQLKNCQSK